MNADPRPTTPVPTTVPMPPPFAQGVWADQLDSAGQPLTWLWHGYLAPGNLTLLTAQSKTGKTTLLSVLLARLKDGGDLAGLAVTAGKAVVLSEESRGKWHKRHRKLDLGHVVFFCRPFRRRPRLAEWEALLDHVADLHRQHGFGLVVVDTLTTLLPGRCESNAATLIDALLPVQHLAERGLSVLLLHHPRKGLVLSGQAARGSGALPAFVNISLEMSLCDRANDQDRRRRLVGFSHHDETPRQLVLELNAEGTDYRAVNGDAPDEFLEDWAHLRLVLEDAPDKWTRQQILEAWSNDFPRPSGSTLWRWLQRAVALKLLCQEGSGRRKDPFLYWLPEREAQWRADPVQELMQRISDEGRQLRRQGRWPLGAEGRADPVPAPGAGAVPEVPSAVSPAPPSGSEAGSAAAPASLPAMPAVNAEWLRAYLPVVSKPPAEG
jgi:AAA domain